MTKEKLLRIIDRFAGKKLIVIGDIMLDKYIWGEVKRISPEAPVQVVNVKKETFSLGGAANTANNIVALGGRCSMAGILGEDEAANLAKKMLKEKKIGQDGIITDSRPTTQKIRVMAQSQQLLRIDYEEDAYSSAAVQKKLQDAIAKVGADVIVLSDYAKGVITRHLVEDIVKKNKGKIIVADPKPKHFSYYKGVTIVTPNLKEASEAAHLEEKSEKDIITIGKKLMGITGMNVLITRGEKGMSLFEKKGVILHIPTKAKEVFDVSGAGDTVTGTLALALAAGATLAEASMLANYAAGVKVGKIGTSTVSIQELKDAISHDC